MIAQIPLKIGILISGRGSNLKALIDHSLSQPNNNIHIVLVIANRADAQGLAYAKEAHIPHEIVDEQHYPDRETFERVLHDRLCSAGVMMVCLAGFMAILSAQFISLWWNRILNIHPSLLPAFRGLNTHARVIAAGIRWTGCTVHMVRATIDTGPILIQGVVPVYESDDPETLAQRVLHLEHQCYPLAVHLIAQGRVHIDGERAIIQGNSPHVSSPLINPIV